MRKPTKKELERLTARDRFIVVNDEVVPDLSNDADGERMLQELEELYPDEEEKP